tara:strand:+ start:111 stop:533 length:423 start_codon:yes stop_codon:yes gene_type:complete
MTYNKAGLGSVGSYQVSGKPFCKNITDLPLYSTTATEIAFPAVTQWITIQIHDNADNRPLRIGFSKIGVEDVGGDLNYFIYRDSPGGWDAGNPFTFKVKCTSLWIAGHVATIDGVSIMAGLTGIDTNELVGNWSGSLGVG